MNSRFWFDEKAFMNILGQGFGFTCVPKGFIGSIGFPGVSMGSVGFLGVFLGFWTDLDGPGWTWTDPDGHGQTRMYSDRPGQTWGSHGFQMVLPDFGT